MNPIEASERNILHGVALAALYISTADAVGAA